MRRIRGSASAKADLAFLLAGAATGGASRSPVFVLDPTATPGGNVFTTWTSLMAAMSLVQGEKTVDVRHDANTDAGTWNINGVRLTTSNFAILTIVTGTVLQATRFTVDGLFVQHNGTAPAMSVTAALDLVLINAGEIDASSAGAFLEAKAGSAVTITLYDSFMGDGADPVVTVDAAVAAQLYAFDTSQVATDAIAGAGTFRANHDASSTIGTQTVTTLTLVFSDVAAGLGYTPGVAGNWQPAPTATNAALDQLAAPNFVQASATAQGPAVSVNIVTGNIAKKRSGIVRITAFISCSTSAQDNVIFTLQRDGVNIAGAPSPEITSAGAADFVEGHMTWYDTLPDAANHTYSITATHTAANLTQGANSGAISVQEL